MIWYASVMPGFTWSALRDRSPAAPHCCFSQASRACFISASGSGASPSLGAASACLTGSAAAARRGGVSVAVSVGLGRGFAGRAATGTAAATAGRGSGRAATAGRGPGPGGGGPGGARGAGLGPRAAEPDQIARHHVARIETNDLGDLGLHLCAVSSGARPIGGRHVLGDEQRSRLVVARLGAPLVNAVGGDLIVARHRLGVVLGRRRL